MTPSGMIDMIWDALEMLAEKPRRGAPRPVRMKLFGTVAAPEIYVEVVDPNPPTPDMAKGVWIVTTEGIRQAEGSAKRIEPVAD